MIGVSRRLLRPPPFLTPAARPTPPLDSDTTLNVTELWSLLASLLRSLLVALLRSLLAVLLRSLIGLLLAALLRSLLVALLRSLPTSCFVYSGTVPFFWVVLEYNYCSCEYKWLLHRSA